VNREVDHSMRSWDPPFWIGDRQFTDDDLVLLKEIVRRYRRLCRVELAATLCENLPWKAPNGKLKIDACRLLLEDLATSRIIELPPKRFSQKRHSGLLKEAPLPCALIEGPLKQFRPVTVDPVPLDEQPLFNATINAYHPLGYRIPCGAHQRYFIRSKDHQILGLILFAAAAKALADRDAWIGWTALERGRFLFRIVNNTRFLILPGVRVPHLASHALSLATRRLRPDWQERYGYAPALVETFVTPPHRGTCYRAANWRFLGETGSTNRRDRKKRGHVPIKMIFALPLTRNWRTELLAPAPDAPSDEEQEADLDAPS
jgi:hypothetical protein